MRAYDVEVKSKSSTAFTIIKVNYAIMLTLVEVYTKNKDLDYIIVRRLSV